MRGASLVLLLLAVAAACKQPERAPERGSAERVSRVVAPIDAAAGLAQARSDLPGRPAPRVAPIAAVPSDAEIEAGAWNQQARIDALQGAWVFPPSSRAQAVLDVNGTHATYWDGMKEAHVEVKLPTPCTMVLSEDDRGGSSYSLALHDGRAVIGMGDAGLRVGNEAVACAGFDVFVLRGSTCRAWSPLDRAWRKATCRFERTAEAGEELVIEDVHDHAHVDIMPLEQARFASIGDALLSDQLRMAHAVPAVSYGSGRALSDTYATMADDAPRLPVGDMSTPAGLVATMFNERFSGLYLQNPVTVVGVVSGTGQRSVGLQASKTLELRDTAQPGNGPVIACATNDIASIGERIFVSGRVAWWSMTWGRVASELVLVDCRVTSRG